MELIVQKAVELGASQVVPVATRRSVVKLDEKKAAKKTQRWQQIAESAAKQAGRGYIPQVSSVPVSYTHLMQWNWESRKNTYWKRSRQSAHIIIYCMPAR